MLDAIEMKTQAEPTASLIVLHGLGADGQDFVPIVQALRLQGVGGLRVVLPHAPVMPVTINGGQRMRAWYDIRGTALDRQEDEAGLRASLVEVHGLITREIERGIPASRIVLMGFSQGCAMTLMAGLRFPERLAGLIGLSGYLPLLPQTEAEAHPANADVPIFLAHGLQDAVVPLARAHAARAELQRLGYAPQWQDYPMGHEVCIEEIDALSDWLSERLGSAAPST
ncbi:carboxylesterase [Paucibacter sp. APW11]|uniref:Carboxylesterase n=1 Tax=Roseateles aquae TaxID=3077235 RepID=A0ABU3PDV7_9BURK|nr:carboxylesterase [Paucibacter sp. APW11]MDT9000784.1 carboxylesterase [Paucibacter sp. APW11]